VNIVSKPCDCRAHSRHLTGLRRDKPQKQWTEKTSAQLNGQEYMIAEDTGQGTGRRGLKSAIQTSNGALQMIDRKVEV
jgi:hypothetical protein